MSVSEGIILLIVLTYLTNSVSSSLSVVLLTRVVLEGLRVRLGSINEGISNQLRGKDLKPIKMKYSMSKFVDQISI